MDEINHHGRRGLNPPNAGAASLNIGNDFSQGKGYRSLHEQ